MIVMEFTAVEIRKILKISVIQRRLVLRSGAKFLWLLYFCGFMSAGLYFLRVVVNFLLSEHSNQANSGKAEDIEKDSAIFEAEMTDLVNGEQSTAVATWRETWILATVVVAFLVVSNLAGIPLSVNVSLGLGAMITSPSTSTLPTEEEISVEDVVFEPKRFPGGFAIFVLVMTLSNLLQIRAGRAGRDIETTPQTYPDFPPFRPFDSSQTTLVCRSVPEDDISALNASTVGQTSDEELSESLRSECEGALVTHFFDMID